MEETSVSRKFGRTYNSSRLEADRSSEWNGLKIPPFNSKEDWKTWINRFEVIAERSNWSAESKLDNILPKNFKARLVILCSHSNPKIHLAAIES